MKINLRSLRAQLIFMVVLISSVGMVSSIFIVNMNYDHSVQETREATEELIKQEFITLTNKHNKLLQEFGLRIQRNELFRKAIKQKDRNTIQNLLDEEFYQYFVTAKVLVVNKIYAFDKNYQLLSESSKGNDFNSNARMCGQLVESAKRRKGAERIKLTHSFCYHHEHALNSIIVPIGTLVPQGYLQIISRPYNIFQSAESKLGMPLRIETTTDQLSYESDNWQEKDARLLTIDHKMDDINGKPAISVVMEKDISRLNQSFAHSRQLIILSVGFISLLCIVIFYYRFEKHMVKPLKNLGNKLSEIEEDENQLGNTLTLEGSPEIQAITHKFNKLSLKLANFYGSLEKLAYRDPLTTLPNRSKLQEIVDFHTSLNQRDGTPFSLFIMGIDRFKHVNETMGHRAGDELLQEISKRLSKILRKSDYLEIVSDSDKHIEQDQFISRLGGDEFAAVLPAVSEPETVIAIAEKIQDSLRDTFIINQFSFNLGVSIGIVLCPEHGNTTQILMQHADLAMHHAKENQLGFTLYNSRLSEHSLNILSMDSELRKAIKNNELTLAFQPKIDLKSNKVAAVEVLLRWIHKEQGFIPPDKFIAVAEHTGLINDVTHWVLCAALKQKHEWDKQNIHFSISINLSAKNLWDKNLLPVIRTELRKYGIMPQSVILELTETAVMSDPAYAIIVLKQLSDLGLKISIDDFGTGYSSLSYLKKLPVDEIKIDRSFVMEMENDENDAVIVQSTIDLAHNMGLQVVAEGVETLSALDNLKQHSCDLAQGFYMAKPMSNNELIEWLKNSPWGNLES